MRVKRLDLIGFKSFAKRTAIQFEPGVTAIVGPNGSGKTNLVESIRWVLGEHNPRDVRAPRLEDIIFNGTDRLAPVSMAEVNLTIDNEQGLLPISFSEVTITRRAYRSGESECCINQSPCRLKDIQELFLGTGLGGGTYAIMEQGHIDLILSSKPEERRVVFEEASGIAKYLAKRQETMRRLDEVEGHLVRIADIIAEVRRQVSALERAANKARQYKTQWEQLKQTELLLAVDELRVGVSLDRELAQHLEALTAQRQALDTQKQGYVSSMEAFNATISAIQGKLQELRTKAVECTSQMEQHESQFALKTRWIEELTAHARQVEGEGIQLGERLKQLDEQLARVDGLEQELNVQLATVQLEHRRQEGELAAIEAALQGAITAVEAAKAHLFEAASDASHQRNQLTEVSSQRQALEAQLARLEEQRVQRAAHAEEVRRRCEATDGERDTLRAQQEEIQRRVATAQQAREAAGILRHELTGRLHQLRDQVASERARVTFLEDLWRRYEGFPDTVKTLMGRSVDGLIGPLADLVQAVAGYEELVEAALGPLTEALVVKDREALVRCRATLGAEQLEGCRFLVLSDCPQGAGAHEPAAAHDGMMGAARQYVRTTPPYEPLVEWILNDSWVIDDVSRLLSDHALPQGRFVSPRGERWDRRSWRLGSFHPSTDGSPSTPDAVGEGRRVGRKQRWEDSRQTLQAIEEQLRELDEHVKEAERDWQVRLREEESVKGLLAHVAPSLLKLDAHVTQLTHDAQRLDEECRVRALEIQELTAQREELRAVLAEKERAVDDTQERQRAIERALTDAQAARDAAQSHTQQLAIAQAQAASTIQSLSERLLAAEARRQELQSDRMHLLRQREAKTVQRQEAAQRSAELSQQLAEHETRRLTLQEDRSRLEVELEAVSRSLRDEETKREGVLPHLLNVEQQLSELMRTIQEREQQRSERTFRCERLAERLRELYHIDDTTLQAECAADISPLTEEQRAAMAGEVQKLHAKLEGLGPVSLGSVEEYDELKRRLEFLQTQQQDLMQARDDLKSSITQINRTARAQFRETFEKIRQEFKTYFTRLFDGGDADLVLLDQDDVLESGIEIIARPPGKRLQSISLLSGGERALTAVALLFALFKVRPSPLCILDEIDASLDEANVDRFTRVLEEFLSLSQFILVTHNKKTITKADSLYGVTMEEPGISKILSAKLTPAEPASTPA